MKTFTMPATLDIGSVNIVYTVKAENAEEALRLFREKAQDNEIPEDVMRKLCALGADPDGIFLKEDHLEEEN